MGANHFLLLRVQFICIAVTALALIYFLRLFRYYSSLPLPLGQKVFYLTVVDRVIGLFIFIMKLCLCFDSHLRRPYMDGCLSGSDGKANSACIAVLCCASAANWIVFLYVKQDFFIQLLVFAILLIMEIWIIYSCHLFINNKQTRNMYFRKFYPGFNQPLNDREIRTLGANRYEIINKMIDFGTFGTIYKSVYYGVNDVKEELVLKVIDIIEWNKNRAALDRIGDEVLTPIREAFIQNVDKLRALDHKNVVKFQRIHVEEAMGVFQRMYMFTKEAQMSLDHFLSKIKPQGVSEEWARKWFTQVADGVNYLHHIFDPPFPHSNIKPENILLFRRQTKNEDIYEMVDQFELKLSDCGFDSFLPMNGKVVTKRQNPIVISAPKNVCGKKYIRIMKDNIRGVYDKKYEDIYQLGVVLLLLVKGDITGLIHKPIEMDRIANLMTGVDGAYVRFDRILDIKRLPGVMSEDLLQLLKKMLNSEPLLRYDINSVLKHSWMTQCNQI